MSDCIGCVRRPHIEEDGWYADIEFLPNAPLFSSKYRIGHNACGRMFQRPDGQWLCDEITSVRSVDIVPLTGTSAAFFGFDQLAVPGPHMMLDAEQSKQFRKLLGEETKATTGCMCSTHVLMTSGCQCGGK